MDAYVGHAISVFMGFFAIMNPIANTPVFLGLTTDAGADERRRIATKALVTSFLIVLVFSVSGKLIFDLFGITLPAFRIMGGLLVALVGYQMLHGGKHSPVQQPSDEDTQRRLDAEMEVAITPLAMPILAGPGTIATAMSFAAGANVLKLIVTVAAFFVLCVITYLFFISGERLVRYIGDIGIKVTTRLMGLILAVIGVQMLIDGIGGAVSAFQNAGAG